MIATAAYILADAYASVHHDEYDPDGGAVLFGLVIMMVFDLMMVSAL